MDLRVRRLATSFFGGLLICGTIVSCVNRELQPLNPCTQGSVIAEDTTQRIDDVDLLFVIDKSDSMSQEQDKLAAQLEELVRGLSSGDVDGDGNEDFKPAKTLRVATVSTDLGASGNQALAKPQKFCAHPGDDAIFSTQRGAFDEGAIPASLTGCSGKYPAFQDFNRETDDAVAFAAKVKCAAAVGIKGCGFEQQLESMLKAITPKDDELKFIDDNGALSLPGSSDRIENMVNGESFLRDDAFLAVIVVADEDDCSVVDNQIYVPNSPKYASYSVLNARCGLVDKDGVGGLHPIQRYVDGLLARRPANRLFFGAIVGVGSELVRDGKSYDAILGDGSMVRQLRADGKQLEPSCSSADGVAYPPARIVRLAKALEEASVPTTVQSICEESFVGALQTMAKIIGDNLGSKCLERSLNRNAAGLVNCTMTEQLPVGMTCASLADRGRGKVVGVVQDGAQAGAEICEFLQRPIASDADLGSTADEGWYYDDFSSSVTSECKMNKQALAFTANAAPVTNSKIRFECIETVPRTSGEAVLNSPCTEDAGCQSMSLRRMGTEPFCEKETKTCQLRCASSADCPGGFVCPDFAGYCVNPTCPEG